MSGQPTISDDVEGQDAQGDVPAQTELGEISDNFDETTYLRAFPDIAEAVRRGTMASGRAHFERSGRAEGRLDKPEYRQLRGIRREPMAPSVAIDALSISYGGAALMTGWTDDRDDALVEVTLETRAGTRHTWTAIPRLVRADVERTLDADEGHPFGFLLTAAPEMSTPRDTSVSHAAPSAARSPVFTFASGVRAVIQYHPVIMSDTELRDQALAALPIAAGDAEPEGIRAMLDQHAGAQIATLNRLIVDHARNRRIVERFGPALERPAASVITTIRGGADQIVPRLTLTACGMGGNAFEFIFVVTDKEQFEPAMRAAQVAEQSLDATFTLILQPEGDAACASDDVAMDIVRSNRLIFMDPSVFPRDPHWAFKHTTLLETAPELATRLMGGLLYHADGSLAHGGYYFAREDVFLPRPDGLPRRTGTVHERRITHPAPGAIADRLAPRQVTAIPAAFMSVDRSWFEVLGGFTRRYSRASCEDLDFCLRSLSRGITAWVHPLHMWYFERLPVPRPLPMRGGVIFNSWLFHRQWDELIASTPGQAGI